MYQKILFATDGSPTSDLALREAARLAGDGATLRVVVVVENPALSFPAPYGVTYDVGAMREAVLEGGRQILAQTLDSLKKQGVKAEGHLVDLTLTVSGNIARAIIAEANSSGCEAIVIGSHGRSGVKRLLLGSVAENVMRASNLPVLLVRGKPPEPAGSALNPGALYGDWPEDEIIKE